MYTIVISNAEMTNLFNKHKYLFSPYINNGEIDNIIWDENGIDLKTSLPDLLPILAGKESWQALILFDATNTKEPENPFMFTDSSCFYKEDPEPLIKLTYFLTGLPTPIFTGLTPVQTKKHYEMLDLFPSMKEPPEKVLVLLMRKKLSTDGTTIDIKRIKKHKTDVVIGQSYGSICQFLYFNVPDINDHHYEVELCKYFSTALTVSLNFAKFSRQQDAEVVFINELEISNKEISSTFNNQITKLLKTKKYINDEISARNNVSPSGKEIIDPPTSKLGSLDEVNEKVITGIRSTLQNLINQEGDIVLTEELEKEIDKKIIENEGSITNKKIAVPPEKEGNPPSLPPKEEKPKDWETDIKPEVKAGLTDTMYYPVFLISICFFLLMIHTKFGVISLLSSILFFSFIYITIKLRNWWILCKEHDYNKQLNKLEKAISETITPISAEQSSNRTKPVSVEDYFKYVYNYMYWQSLKVRAKQFKEVKQKEISFLKNQEQILDKEIEKYLNIVKLFNIKIDTKMIALPDYLGDIDFDFVKGVSETTLNLDPLPANNANLITNSGDKYRQPYKFISKIEFRHDGPLY